MRNEGKLYIRRGTAEPELMAYGVGDIVEYSYKGKLYNARVDDFVADSDFVKLETFVVDQNVEISEDRLWRL